MPTHNEPAFSDGHTLTGWLVKLGAPEPLLGVSYRIDTHSAEGPEHRSPTVVTVSVYNGHTGRIEAQASEITRVAVDMAAVAAAHRAYEEFLRVRTS